MLLHQSSGLGCICVGSAVQSDGPSRAAKRVARRAAPEVDRTLWPRQADWMVTTATSISHSVGRARGGLLLFRAWKDAMDACVAAWSSEAATSVARSRISMRRRSHSIESAYARSVATCSSCSLLDSAIALQRLCRIQYDCILYAAMLLVSALLVLTFETLTPPRRDVEPWPCGGRSRRARWIGPYGLGEGRWRGTRDWARRRPAAVAVAARASVRSPFWQLGGAGEVDGAGLPSATCRYAWRVVAPPCVLCVASVAIGSLVVTELSAAWSVSEQMSRRRPTALFQLR